MKDHYTIVGTDDPLDKPRLTITPDNFAARVDEAIRTIIHCWSDWEGVGEQDAQQEQSPDAYFREMDSQLRAVLFGMLLDEVASPEETSERFANDRS